MTLPPSLSCHRQPRELPMSQSRPASTLMRVFERGLHAEHLEEVSFLYEQRLGQLKNPAMAWSGLAEIEDRIEAHLDALVVGGELALEVCRERAAQGDFGELFAAVSVFCRSQRPPLLARLLTPVFALARESGYAFDPGVGALTAAWGVHFILEIEIKSY